MIKKISALLILSFSLMIPFLCQAGTIVLSNASPDAIISAGENTTVYGTAAANTVTLENNAQAKLLNFPGSNTITILSNASLFTVFRSGAYVTFEGTDGTILRIPATKNIQTIEFAEQTLTLNIYNNQVLLDDQVITSTHAFIEGVSENPNTLPFLDTVNRPANINPGTVITTDNHQMWVVAEGSYYAGTQRTETAYFYEENNHVKMSYIDSGVSFTVAEMPDIAPVRSSTIRPGNMNPGTILILDNEQVWKITEGNYYGGITKREDVIVYLMNGDYHMSFQTSGVTMKVEQIITD